MRGFHMPVLCPRCTRDLNSSQTFVISFTLKKSGIASGLSWDEGSTTEVVVPERKKYMRENIKQFQAAVQSLGVQLCTQALSPRPPRAWVWDYLILNCYLIVSLLERWSNTVLPGASNPFLQGSSLDMLESGGIPAPLSSCNIIERHLE